MNRRAALPGAAELFRTTARRSDSSDTNPGVRRQGSGRRKHDTKITVYLSDDEVLELEQARLALRAEHGVVVDRGRIVREAVAVLLEDLEQQGEQSVRVRRLRQELDEGPHPQRRKRFPNRRRVIRKPPPPVVSRCAWTTSRDRSICCCS